MRVRFYGTRGSIATPGTATLRHGGNTSCVAVRSASGTLVLLDIGTGAAVLGRELMEAGGKLRGHILIGHTHWDHIQGLPFFEPLFVPGNEWDIYAPRGLRQTLRDTLAGQMEYTYFPVELEQLGATIRYHDLVEGNFRVGDINVTAQYLNHPALTLGYRLQADGATVVYSCDHEPHSRALAIQGGEIEGQDRRHAEFLADADLVIHDAQYVASEFANKIGWGHSTVEYAIAVARFARAKRLALTHHDPLRTDAALDTLVAAIRSRGDTPGLEVFAAAEGAEIELHGDTPAPPAGGFPADLAIESALVGSTVLIAMTTPERIATLTTALAHEDVQQLVVSPMEATAAVAAREGPGLLVLEDTGDAAAAAIASAIRTLRADLPIVLVTADEGAALIADGAFDDRLVEPFSPSYARARLRAALMRRACRWRRADKPRDEAQRITSLHRLEVIDTPPEERFDRIARLAAALFDLPIALISLVDRDRQWFKASCGLDARETPRDESFCAHAVLSREPLVIPDALLDARFAENPLVIGPPRVRFYAGCPLFLTDGSCIGTLCILDTRPRELDERGLALLRSMAELAMGEFERAAAPTAPTAANEDGSAPQS
ncbi:MAG TPA: GAF domain-containing protein [Stellaceae bacterium]|nr:GAF domain-containing protein [Stellaceae bacterium]